MDTCDDACNVYIFISLTLQCIYIYVMCICRSHIKLCINTDVWIYTHSLCRKSTDGMDITRYWIQLMRIFTALFIISALARSISKNADPPSRLLTPHRRAGLAECSWSTISGMCVGYDWRGIPALHRGYCLNCVHNRPYFTRIIRYTHIRSRGKSFYFLFKLGSLLI